MEKLITRSGKLISRGGNLVGRAVPTPVVEYFEMIVKTDNAGTSGNNQFTIPTTGVGYDYTVETSEQLLTGQTGNVTLEWASAGTHLVRIKGDFPRIFFNNQLDRQKLIEVSNWGDIVWSNMRSAFWGCSNLNVTANDAPNLSNVTDMSNIFTGASIFNGDISSWNVSNVTNMSAMFFNASAFNSDISSWDVSNVTNMSLMFFGASSFNGDISSWNVSNVTNMHRLFQNASSFNSDISGWDVSNVTNMSNMFRAASSFNRDLSYWCVEQIASEPTDFDLGANSWVLPRPNWGVVC